MTTLLLLTHFARFDEETKCGNWQKIIGWLRTGKFWTSGKVWDDVENEMTSTDAAASKTKLPFKIFFYHV